MKKYFLTILSIALIASFVITSRETQKLTSLVETHTETINYVTETVKALEWQIERLYEDIKEIRIANEYLIQEIEGE